MALKSNSASYNFSAERSLMPGIALQYLRREPARREGACRSTKDANTKKAAAFHNEAALSKIFVLCTIPNLCATGNHKTGGRIYV